jgi:hypothetical protein
VPGDRAYLVRDRGNRFSKNAVEVRLHNGVQAGYVPEEIAIELAPLLDQGLPHTGVLTKVLTGGRTPIPVMQARLFRVDAGIADLVLEHEVPAAAAVQPLSSPRPPGAPVPAPTLTQAAARARTGCLPVVLLLLGAMGLAVPIITFVIRP